MNYKEALFVCRAVRQMVLCSVDLAESEYGDYVVILGSLDIDKALVIYKSWDGRFVLTKGRKGLPLDSSPVLDKLSFTLAKLTNCFVSV